MFILKLTLKACLSKWKRFAIFICLTALLSFLIGLLGNYFLYKDKAVDPVTIVIADMDNSVESRMFLGNITSNEQYNDFLVFESKTEAEARLMLERNEAAAVFIIPKDFAAYIKNGENQPFTAIYNSSMPLKVALIEYFANGLTQMLAASQIGVYTALDYAWENGTQKQYDTMFRTVNMKYMSTVLGRSKILDTAEVSVVGRVSPFQYYFFAAYIFIMLAGTILFVDILHGVFTRDTLIRLRLARISSVKITIAAILSVFVVLILINGIFGVFLFYAKDIAAQIPLNKELLLGLAVILLCVSAFTVLVSQMFKNVFSAGVFISLFSLVTLFVSGGIIPIDYLSASINTLSRFTLNFWSVRLLSDAALLTTDYYVIKVILLFILIYSLLSFIVFSIKARAGDTV